MKSIRIYETQDGGDYSVTVEKGILADDYLSTAVYIALFGGNVEANSKEQYIRFERNCGYFGNVFCSKPYNSETERTVFNSVNVILDRENIKRAVRADLRKLQPFPIQAVENVEVEADNSPKRVKITIEMTTPAGETAKVVI